MLFSIKDNINIKGYPTTCSSKILKNHKSLYDATVISRIESSGGLIVAKTNLEEFGMGSSNQNSKKNRIKRTSTFRDKTSSSNKSNYITKQERNI